MGAGPYLGNVEFAGGTGGQTPRSSKPAQKFAMDETQTNLLKRLLSRENHQQGGSNKEEEEAVSKKEEE